MIGRSNTSPTNYPVINLVMDNTLSGPTKATQHACNLLILMAIILIVRTAEPKKRTRRYSD